MCKAPAFPSGVGVHAITDDEFCYAESSMGI